MAHNSEVNVIENGFQPKNTEKSNNSNPSTHKTIIEKKRALQVKTIKSLVLTQVFEIWYDETSIQNGNDKANKYRR
jgi:hypothetical protein